MSETAVEMPVSMDQLPEGVVEYLLSDQYQDDLARAQAYEGGEENPDDE